MKRQVSIGLEPSLFLEIETRRGLIPLSTYIEAILKEALEDAENDSVLVMSSYKENDDK